MKGSETWCHFSTFQNISITCLVPLTGFHFGSIINWLSKCEILMCCREVPSLNGSNLVFLALGGEILRAWKGNTISDPLALISSERWGSLKLDVTSALFKSYVSITCLVPLKGFQGGHQPWQSQYFGRTSLNQKLALVRRSTFWNAARQIMDWCSFKTTHHPPGSVFGFLSRKNTEIEKKAHVFQGVDPSENTLCKILGTCAQIGICHLALDSSTYAKCQGSKGGYM